MEFFRDSKYDFLGARKFWIPVSFVAVVISIVVMVQGGLNVGIDFAGGTQLILRFGEAPDVQELRQLLAAAGVDEPRIQRYGEAEANEVLIKTPTVEGSDEGSRGVVEEAFDRRYNVEAAGRFDVNKRGSDALAALLFDADPDAQKALGESEAREHYRELAATILEVRNRQGLIEEWSDLEGIGAVSAAVRESLQERAFLGHFAVLGAENVGPQIGGELRTKGILAVAFSLVGMLLYIWLRFELRFGVGALVALSHDVVICLGLYALLGYEFNLTTIAAFLTVVGYSVNDSVVVFDRVRENLRRTRREPLETLLNRSLNQTLSRTVLTSGTTLLAVGTLFLFGGNTIRGFAFVLMVGVLVGTYSSIFIASPVVLVWERLLGRDRRSGRGGGSGRSGRLAAA